ncbi:MAG: WG repeat-containing protein, partial [Bacteroidota bacterium]
MDTIGRQIVAPVYDLIGSPDAFGYLVAQSENKLGLLGSGGIVILPPRFDDIQVLDANILAVLEGDVWRVINLVGETILDGDYLQLRPLGAGLLAFRRTSGWGVIRSDGQELITPTFEDINLHPRGYFITEQGSKQGLADLQGRTILPSRADSIHFDTLGIILYQSQERWGGVALDGQVLFPPNFRQFSHLGKEHLLLTGSQQQSVYANACKTLFSIGIGTELLPFSNNYLAFRQQGKIGVFSRCGTIVLPANYEEVQPFANDLFRVRQGGFWGLLKVNDQPVLPFKYDYISPLVGRVASIRQGSSFGFVNFKGEVLQTPSFARLELEEDRVRAFTELSNGSNLITFSVNRNGQLSSTGESAQHFRIRVAGQPSNTPAAQEEYAEYSTRVLPAHEWFYAVAEGRWGLRSRIDGTISIPPTFTQLEVLPELGLSLVGLTKSTELTLERTTFRANQVFGLLLNAEGLLVTELNLLDLRVEDWQNGNGVARCLFENGRFGLIDRRGRVVRRDLAYIGEFSEGFAPLSIRGYLSGSVLDTETDLPLVPDFLSDVKTAVFLADYTAYDQQFARHAQLQCKNCEWGFVDQFGNLTVTPRFNKVGDFTNGYAIVTTSSGVGIIDQSGQFVATPTYSAIEAIKSSTGTNYLLRNEKALYGLVDTLGQLQISAKYQDIGSLSDQLIAFADNGRWGYLDAGEEIVIPPIFLSAGTFSEGIATVEMPNGWTYITIPKADRRFDPQNREDLAWLGRFGFYQGLGNFRAGLAWATEGESVGYIDTSGNFLIPAVFDRAHDFEGDVARVVQDGRVGLVGRSGSWVLRPKYAEIQAFQSNDVAIVRLVGTQDRFSIIDRTGRQLTNKTYRRIENFKEGRALVRDQNGFGYLDERGREVISPSWGVASSFSGSRAVVQKNGRCGYIDLSGKLVIPCQYSRCQDFDGKRAVVYRSIRNAGLIDPNGKELISPSLDRLLHFREGRGLMRDNQQGFYFITDKAALYDGYYDEAKPFYFGVAAIRRGDRWGLINHKGMPLLRPKF